MKTLKEFDSSGKELKFVAGGQVAYKGRGTQRTEVGFRFVLSDDLKEASHLEIASHIYHTTPNGRFITHGGYTILTPELVEDLKKFLNNH